MSRPLTELPKAHLHLHFTGAMRHSTLVELARLLRPRGVTVELIGPADARAARDSTDARHAGREPVHALPGGVLAGTG